MDELLNEVISSKEMLFSLLTSFILTSEANEGKSAFECTILTNESFSLEVMVSIIVA